jgi:hypothetical protein
LYQRNRDYCIAVVDLTGLFWTRRFVRNCLGKELGDAEE